MKAITGAALLLTSFLIPLPFAQAEKVQLLGLVSMNGSIVDSACAIDIGSYEQSVDMGILPVSAIRQQGHGPVHPFSIKLIGCQLVPIDGSNWKTFSVTFDGASLGEWFTVSGEARGVALLLQDAQGNSIYPGKSMARQNIVQGEAVLNYGLRLVSDNKPLRPGEYQSAIRFKLDYY